jgi:peptidyl-prolyl cis-trans isomerase C
MTVLRAGPMLNALLIVAAGAACRRSAQDPAILELGHQVVRRSDFERHLAALESRDGPLAAEVRAALLEPFLEERILVLEARNRELLKAPASAEEEQRAVRELLEREVLSRVAVAEAEVAADYATHRAELAAPERVALRQILVPTEVEARDVLRRLRREPRSFESLARTRSRGPEAERGGVMGSFARGELPPELEAAAFALAEGGLSGVVASPLGFHILKLDGRQPARERSLEECRAEIRGRLERDKSDRAVRQFVRGLLSRAKVDHEAAHAPRL